MSLRFAQSKAKMGIRGLSSFLEGAYPAENGGLRSWFEGAQSALYCRWTRSGLRWPPAESRPARGADTAAFPRKWQLWHRRVDALTMSGGRPWRTRVSLSSMQLSAVRQYSLAEGGLDATAVNLCMVAAEPKAALIALLFADPAELEPQPAEPGALLNATPGTSTAEMTAARIGALLAGDEGQRAVAYAELAAIANGDGVGATSVATACVAPLVDSVLCADASRVDRAEAQRASLLLGGMILLDPLAVGAEWIRNDRYLAAWNAPNSVLAASTHQGGPTRDDVMLAACGMVGVSILMSKGTFPSCACSPPVRSAEDTPGVTSTSLSAHAKICFGLCIVLHVQALQML